MDHDDGIMELERVMGFTRRLRDTEAIARVEAAGSPSRATPFSYFLDAARN